MRLDALAKAIGARLEGPPDVEVERVGALWLAGPGELAGFFERRYRVEAGETRAGAVITSPELQRFLPAATPRIVADDARTAWGRALRVLNPRPTVAPPPVGVHPMAIVDPSAELGPEVCIGPFVQVGAGARIGPRSQLFAGVYIGPRAKIGADCVLHPRATVLDACEVHDDVFLGSGAVIGSPGFGIDADGRIPHLGFAVIGKGATVGANSCVDRATLGATSIGPHAHLDNLVQVGHNASVGWGAVLCGQVGLAGRAVVGDGAVIGGQAGVKGGARVGPGARVAAQSGVTRSLPGGADYSGHPAEPNRARLKRLARLRKLVER